MKTVSYLWLAGWLLAFPFCFGHLLAQTENESSHEDSGRRVALVIGNGAYENSPKLKNPSRDAADVEFALRSNGYEVTKVIDGSNRDLARTLADWQEEAADAESAVFFFAGHGVEVDGKNYLLPVDAEVVEKGDLQIEALSLQRILGAMKEARIRLKIVVLDCCRDNPLPERSWLSSRSEGGGLAKVDKSELPEGTLLVFSGAPGKTVPDGLGRNSPFTEALVSQLKRPGLAATSVFSEVSTVVASDQEPWITFDGSGRSFAAFGAYQLTLGIPENEGETAKSDFEMTPGLRMVPDQYRSIQAAINAAEPGDIVLIKAGVYRENLMISNRDRIEIRGESEETTIIRTSSRDRSLMEIRGVREGVISNLSFEYEGKRTLPGSQEEAEAPSLLEITDSSITLSKGSFQGGRQLNGITIVGGESNVVTDCSIENALKGIVARGVGLEVTIMDNEVSKCRNEGITVRDGATGIVKRNTVNENGKYGIRIEAEAEASVIGNETRKNQAGGIVFFEATGVGEDNTSTDNKYHGLVTKTSEVTFRNNTSRGNGEDGIHVCTGATAKLIGNTCMGNGRGITVHSESSGEFVSNVCQENDGAGIAVNEASPLIEKNRCHGNTLSGIIVEGASSKPRLIDNECNNNTELGIAIESVSYPAEFRGNTAEGNGFDQQIDRNVKFATNDNESE